MPGTLRLKSPDGHASLSYDSATNRITTAGFAYDAAGNQVRALASGGPSQRFQLLGKVLAFVANIPTLVGNFIAGIPKAIAGIFHFAERGTAIVAGIVGNSVLLGASTAAGVVSEHLAQEETGKGKRRREKAERRRQREIRPRRLPPVRLPPDLPEIRTEPQQGKPEVKVQPKPEMPKIILNNQGCRRMRPEARRSDSASIRY